MEPVRCAGASQAGPSRHDVVIMGGGLAGLTLALQLKQRLPALDVLIVERRRHPVPVAAHKVGESSVEIAAWYFGQVLGLSGYLLERQLKKFGFRFFFSDGQPRIDQVTELGASTFLPTPSYQIDRGRFENDLAVMVAAQGCRFADGATVRQFTLARGGRRRGAAAPASGGAAGDDLHAVTYERDGVIHEARSRWLIDAAGRAGLIKRKLDLAEDNAHQAGAVWFRINGRIDVDDWSADPAWLARCNPPNRWLSTIHLVGAGYWVWLIPLASGSHSVGIVADSRLHPIESLDTFDKSLDWLRVHQPQLHAALESKRALLQDFAYFRRFSYGCKQMYCGRSRWALTGEAGVFLDPFYSPGSDFIAVANTQITEMIAIDDAGGPVQMVAGLYEQVFFSLYRNMLPIYVDQYPIFADARVMPVKVLWDYTFYWGIMCPLVIQRRILDLPKMSRLQDRLAGVEQLNIAVQRLLRQWCAQRGPCGLETGPPQLLDQAALDWFAALNAELFLPLDDAAFDDRIERSCKGLESLAAEIVAIASADCPALDAAPVTSLLPPGTIPQAMLFPAIRRIVSQPLEVTSIEHS